MPRPTTPLEVPTKGDKEQGRIKKQPEEEEETAHIIQQKLYLLEKEKKERKVQPTSEKVDGPPSLRLPLQVLSLSTLNLTLIGLILGSSSAFL